MAVESKRLDLLRLSPDKSQHNSKKLIPSSNEPKCTYEVTKTKFVEQPFFRCRTCFTGANDGVCSSCVETCHKGHHTYLAGKFSAYCDCGLKSCKSQCEIGIKCTYDLYGKVGKKQEWYQCLTCWGGESQFGCCEMCAEECHNGHKLVNKGLSQTGAAVCDCGDYRHKSQVCTFYVTSNQHIYQPFYTCRKCFVDPQTQGCCYQCMKTCHAGHGTMYQGVVKAFCDCGLKCCKVPCKIQKP